LSYALECEADAHAVAVARERLAGLGVEGAAEMGRRYGQGAGGVLEGRRGPLDEQLARRVREPAAWPAPGSRGCGRIDERDGGLERRLVEQPPVERVEPWCAEEHSLGRWCAEEALVEDERGAAVSAGARVRDELVLPRVLEVPSACVQQPGTCPGAPAEAASSNQNEGVAVCVLDVRPP
jgi:hypothetical protein